jgi:hypothetical protein
MPSASWWIGTLRSPLDHHALTSCICTTRLCAALVLASRIILCGSFMGMSGSAKRIANHAYLPPTKSIPTNCIFPLNLAQ